MPKPLYQIAVLPGDGIGPEVVASAAQIMQRAATSAGVGLNLTEYPAGAFHYRDTGEAISAATMAAIGEADATLFGAAGWPEIRTREGIEIAPQLDIREHYQLFAGLRPVRLWPGVPRVLAKAEVDMLVIASRRKACSPGGSIRRATTRTASATG